MEILTVKSSAKEQLIDITEEVKKVVSKSGISEGVCQLFAFHTTAGITINENADPDVVRDILMGLQHIVTEDLPYRHLEGNSTAHIKASLIGASETIFIKSCGLELGTWQGVYFCEFDGPRDRKVGIKVYSC